LKLFVLSILLFFSSVAAYAQIDSIALKPAPIKKAKKIFSKPIALPQTVDTSTSVASNADSLQKDSLLKEIIVVSKDSVLKDSVTKATLPPKRAVVKLTKFSDDTLHQKLLSVTNNLTPVYRIIAWRKFTNNDFLFYMLIAVLLLLAVVKLIFPQYFKNIFSLFFQTSFRQKQTKDQLLQNSIPALLLNVLFVAVVALFIAITVTRIYAVAPDFWRILFYASACLMVVYSTKYLFIRFSGWVFDIQESARVYAFIVAVINKIMSVVLLPLLFLVAYSPESQVETVATIALGVVILFLIYRYLLSLTTIRSNLNINAFHFFIYFCGIEALPLFLLYKVLLLQLN